MGRPEDLHQLRNALAGRLLRPRQGLRPLQGRRRQVLHLRGIQDPHQGQPDRQGRQPGIPLRQQQGGTILLHRGCQEQGLLGTHDGRTARHSNGQHAGAEAREIALHTCRCRHHRPTHRQGGCQEDRPDRRADCQSVTGIPLTDA